MKILRTGAKECFDDLPIAVNWMMTKKCNYRCSYCFMYGKGKNPPPQLPFSTLEQLKNAVDNIASLNRPWYDIGLSGGEPTIHPHMFDLMVMLQETLGKRLNRISIVTNGSRNSKLYEKFSEVAKSVNTNIEVSIHTDHVDMNHILELIEHLSRDANIRFLLMFNPDKREMVHEIYETMLKYRKNFPFSMNVVTLRDGDRVDPRYMPEDFEWQKNAVKEFNELAKNAVLTNSKAKFSTHNLNLFSEIEDNAGKKIVKIKNRTLNFKNGMLNFKGMYCTAFTGRLSINETGMCNGIVCGVDRPICNIYEENVFFTIRDKLIHAVKCPLNVCGCIANDRVPKFASEEEAKKYVELAQKRQAQLFAEYDAQKALTKV